jgi:low temperature requirement protein LtrA
VAVDPVPRAADVPERRSTWLELFFDLVFVAAVSALAARLHAHHSLGGLGIFAGLFVPVWWAWWGFTWFSAAFDTDDAPHRGAILLTMLIVAALAHGIPGAARGDSGGFAVAYAGFFYVLSALYARAWIRVPSARPLASRYLAGDLIGATLWLGSLSVGERSRPFVWALAMLVLMTAPVLAARASPFLSYDRRHIAERYGLFTLIVLGESVVVTVDGLDVGSRGAAIATAILGFVVGATIWWVYFGHWRPMPARGIVSGWVWAQGHLLVFAGIAATAVGVELLVESAAAARPSLGERLPLGAGLAAYLVAMALIRWANRRADWVVGLRLASAAALLGVALGADGAAAVVVIGASTGILVAASLVEMIWRPAPTGEPTRLVLPHELPPAHRPRRQ